MDPTIKDFESAIAELETIVKKLEDGDLPLEKSLELYERGVQLSRFCHSQARGGRAAHRDPQRARRGQAGARLLRRRRGRATRGERHGDRPAHVARRQARTRVDAALERFVPTADCAPADVCDAMRYSLFAGGKRLRPDARARRRRGRRRAARRADAAAARTLALPAACALELIHTYSLMHDDLPAMDNDTLRRGRPTAHVVYGEGMAILAGDALLTEAFALLAREPQDGGAIGESELNRRKLRACAIIADAAGAGGMVGGQAIDLQAAVAGRAAARRAPRLREMHAARPAR